MCGISGVISIIKRETELENKVKHMVSAQRHRGPDDEGTFTWHDDRMTVSLGHNRLSIIDVTSDGHQPMKDAESGNVIVYNGEIYNYNELRRELQGKGHIFRSKSDTEVVLKAYSEWGSDCISRLRGIFAFAIWDKTVRILLLARDQMGVKPLYYYMDDENLYFASEVRALLAGGVPRKLSEDGLCSLLCYGSVQEPYSLVENVLSLRPGCFAKIDCNLHVEEYDYWNPDFSSCNATNINEVEHEISRLLEESVCLQQVSDVPLGTFLSGGIDSSAIVALMHKTNPDADLRTFSIIFEDPKFDEREYARLVARRNHTIHTELLMTGEMVRKSLLLMIEAYDQPSMDGMNSWCVSKLVKDSGVTVALSGVGGDELFVGYGNFQKPRQIYHYASIIKGLPHFSGGMIERMAPNERVRKVGELVSYQYDPYFLGRRQYSDRQYRLLVNTDRQVDPYRWLHKSYDRYVNKEYIDDVSRISWYVQRSYMLSTLLRDTDQMSMNHSLEIRVPLIDYKLVEYVTALPKEVKINMQTPKHLLVKAAGTGIPKECIYRKKKGFSFPFDSFIKKDLHEPLSSFYMGDSSDVFNKKGLQTIWNYYQNGRVDWARIIVLYIANQWMTRWNVK